MSVPNFMKIQEGWDFFVDLVWNDPWSSTLTTYTMCYMFLFKIMKLNIKSAEKLAKKDFFGLRYVFLTHPQCLTSVPIIVILMSSSPFKVERTWKYFHISFHLMTTLLWCTRHVSFIR